MGDTFISKYMRKLMTEQPTIYFVRNYKFVLKEYGPVVSTFLGYLIDQDELRKNTRKNYNGSFYVSRGMIAEETVIKRKAQMTCERILKEAGYISFDTEDHNANKYTIKYDAIDEANPKNKVQDEKEDYPQVGGSSILEDTPAPSSSEDRVLTQEGVNYILTKSTTKTVSKSADTYSAEAPNSMHSCIKDKESAQKPPGAHAQSGNDAEIHEIIDQYNTAMGIKSIAEGDYDTVSQHLEDYRKLRKYFTPLGLAYAWKNFPDKGAKEKLTTPRIATIVSFRLMNVFLSRCKEIYAYSADTLDFKLDKLFKYYQEYINQIDPKKYHVNFVGELSMYGSSDCLYGKSHREERFNIYKQYLEPKLLQNEDLHDMIISMEV
jgi:hypothetical protein